MGLIADNNRVCFDGIVYEDTVNELRDLLQEKAPQNLVFDFTECDDMHMAVVQMILAYKKNYSCETCFAEEIKTYQMVIEGFDSSENHCS